MKRYAILALALVAGVAQAEKDTMGLHMGTYHSPNIDCGNDRNPGVYYTHGKTGLTLGTYYNSCQRQTEYVGWRTPSIYGLGLMTVGATGYVKPVTFMVAPTLELNASRFVKDSSVRITGGSWEGMDVYHVSIERRF
jgi:hypothetical protein